MNMKTQVLFVKFTTHKRSQNPLHIEKSASNEPNQCAH